MVLLKLGFVYGYKVQNQVLSVKQGHSLRCALRRGVSGFVCMLHVKRGMGTPRSLTRKPFESLPSSSHTCTHAPISSLIAAAKLRTKTKPTIKKIVQVDRVAKHR